MRILFGLSFLLTIVFCIYLLLPAADTSKNNYRSTDLPSNTPTPFSINEAPKASLTAKLSVISDAVLLKDRIATESSAINSSIDIGQGESIETDNNGKAELLLPDKVVATIESNTSIDIIQTLPVNLVFSLNRGRIAVEKLGTSVVSVRTKHLLTNINGKVEISLNAEAQITIKVISGETILAYNNLKFETQGLRLTEGQEAVFNDVTRRVVVNTF